MSHVSTVASVPNTLHHLCLHHLLRDWAERTPEAIAIAAPGRMPLTYGRFRSHLDHVAQALQVMGLGRHDRIALVLPNGPEMAVAFLAVAAVATCVPLNPAFSADEFKVYFADLDVKALLVQAGTDSPARAVAAAHGIGRIELTPVLEAEAGLFQLTGESWTHSTRYGFAQPEDVALVLPTSGTTSRPKMVPWTQAQLCAGAHNLGVASELVRRDRCLNVMPLFHIHGLLGPMLASLMAGASMVCTPGFDALQFFDWMAVFRPTWYSAVPTIHQAILARAPLHREVIAQCPLRFIRSASASLPQQVLIELERVFNTPVIEFYGMTETAMIASNPLPPREHKIGSVGIATGSEIAIMDDAEALLPTGERGEVVVRGATVMSGYENHPIANERAFTHGWFRTGDQGVMDTDGYLFITGRLTEIINRGGEKIAPREVDEVLMEHPAVDQAVTFAVPDARLGEEVAAAVVLHQHTTATANDMRRFVAARLADFKVPRQVYLLDDIPKGASGKVQRRHLAEALGLKAPDRPLRSSFNAYAVPRTPIEEILAGIWTQVLDLERVGIHDDFFNVGGDSIFATQIISRIREVFHDGVSFVDFFETPTIAGMAERIEANSRSSLNRHAPPLQPLSLEGPRPLSYPQQRLWFLDQLGLSGHAYHLQGVMRLFGALHIAALAQSLQEMLRRHASLRTTFIQLEGKPFQMTGPVIDLPLSVVELPELPAPEGMAQVYRLARQEAQQPFDLARGPLVRATLLRLTPTEHVLLLTMHHIVSDGWSHGIFWREFAGLYDAFVAGKPSPLPDLPIQYADFAAWQLQWLQGEILQTPLAYWKQKLAGASMLLLPTDRPRPTIRTFRGARHPLALTPALQQALKALSQQLGATLFMTLLAAFQTLLHRYSGQDDILVGSLIANRNWIEIEALIGFFVNTLILRADLSGNPRFKEFLWQVREVCIEAYSHQDLPFEKLLEELQPQRDLSHNPLFQMLFVLHNTPQQAPTLPGLTLNILEIDTEIARFDLTLDLWETSEGLRGWFEYNTDLFDAASIARMGGHLQTLLEGIVADPEQRLSTLPLLSADERHQLLVAWNPSRRNNAFDLCLQHLFEAQVARTPEAVAVVGDDGHLTYRELNRRANQVARHLRMLGVGPEILVGLCMERCLEMVVGLLGTLKAGGAYVPLDPTYPPERLAFMLEDAQVPVLLTQERLVARLPTHGLTVVCLDADWHVIARQRDNDLPHRATAENLAYLLYTSGSTGRPKGVLGVHRAVSHALTQLWQAFPFAAQEVCCQKTSISFGDSIQELFGALLRGIRTVLMPHGVLQDPYQFVHMLAAQSVTRVILVPSLLQLLLDTHIDLQRHLPGVTLWISSGEHLSNDLCQAFLERMPHARLVNLYGTAEASDDVTWYDTRLRCSEFNNALIGRPIPNTQLYLLDRHLQPVPIGSSGELYIGGAGLTRGYLKRPGLTAERFIAHPFSDEPGARLYQTGDLARYLPDGNLELIGRLDHQVQLRGVRIELGEVETALRRHSAIHQAIVLAREDAMGDVRLVAYLVVDPSSRPTISALRLFLTTTLPAYMVPAAWVIMDALPMTPSGKVDRRALPVPPSSRPELGTAYEVPQTQVEQTLAKVWQEVLHVETVGIDDNFFDLGGHSLLMTQVYSKLQGAFNKRFSMLDMFNYPTISSFANYLIQMQPERPSFQESHDRARLRRERIQKRHQFDKNTD